MVRLWRVPPTFPWALPVPGTLDLMSLFTLEGQLTRMNATARRSAPASIMSSLTLLETTPHLLQSQNLSQFKRAAALIGCGGILASL